MDQGGAALYALDFEVFGKVQGIIIIDYPIFIVHFVLFNPKFLVVVVGVVSGVFFRKYTEQQANSLGLKGWCMNTNDGTVRGQLEGPKAELSEM